MYKLTCLLLLFLLLAVFGAEQNTSTAIEEATLVGKFELINKHLWKPKARFTVLNEKYYMSTIKENFNGAYYYCVQNGWKLLSIETFVDQFQLDNFLYYYQIANQYYWTSGNKLDSTEWRWGIDGQAFNYTNWAAGEPDNGGPNGNLQQCMALVRKSLTWEDINCNQELYFICETS